MAATPGKRTRATLIEKGTVEEVNSFLQELPEKPKEDLSLKEAVEKLKDPLKEALAKGYNYEDLAKMLAGKGINISALTLKNYIPSGRKQRAAAAKPRRIKKAEEETGSAGLSSSPDQSEESSAPAPQPRRGGRTKSTAMADTSSATTSKPTRRKTTSSSGAAAKPTTTRRRKTSEPT